MCDCSSAAYASYLRTPMLSCQGLMLSSCLCVVHALFHVDRHGIRPNAPWHPSLDRRRGQTSCLDRFSTWFRFIDTHGRYAAGASTVQQAYGNNYAEKCIERPTDLP